MEQELLERIAIAVEGLLASQKASQLGFSKDQRSLYVYVGGDDENHCWYYRENNENIPIHDNMLTGYLTGIETDTTKEHKGKPNHKAHFIFDCGEREIRLISGIDTSFTRSMLLNLYITSSSAISEPMSISVNRGTENTVFSRLRVAGKDIKAPWDKDISCSYLIEHIRDIFGFAGASISPSGSISQDSGSLGLLIDTVRKQLKALGWSKEKMSDWNRKNFQGRPSNTWSITDCRKAVELLKEEIEIEQNIPL